MNLLDIDFQSIKTPIIDAFTYVYGEKYRDIVLLKDIEYSDTGAETAPSDSGSDSSGGEDEFGGSDSSFGGSDDFGGSDSDFGGSESSESETASEDTGATE